MEQLEIHDLEIKFKKLRRQVRATERQGNEPNPSILAELYGIDLVLSEEREDWNRNYAEEAIV